MLLPAFNEAETIEATLKSVLIVTEGYTGSVEIIFVHNNSTDKTSEIALSMGMVFVFEAIN